MIYGVSIIALCMLLGFTGGELIGMLLGLDTNVGGVGFAMLLLLTITSYLSKKSSLTEEISSGIKFWQSLYIPVVIAMTATQNVVKAFSQGLFGALTGTVVIVMGLLIVKLSTRIKLFQTTE